MNEKLFTCSQCSCDHFMTITPHQYKDADINNWASFGLRVYAGIAPVLVCINCSRITIPPISMSGKSRMDPNVAAFGDLIKWVDEHNKPKPDHQCKCTLPQTVSIGHILEPQDAIVLDSLPGEPPEIDLEHEVIKPKNKGGRPRKTSDA